VCIGITFKLYAGLTQDLPPEVHAGNAMPLELPDGATVLRAMQPVNLPMKIVKLVLVNGVYIPPENRPTHALQFADMLAIRPPMAGG
jgi:sulfur carrier protein ThiS